MGMKKHNLESERRKFFAQTFGSTNTNQIRFMSMLCPGLAMSLANSIKYPSV